MVPLVAFLILDLLNINHENPLIRYTLKLIQYKLDLFYHKAMATSSIRESIVF